MREDQEEGGRRQPGRNQSPNMAPVIGIVSIVAIGGVMFAVYANQHKKSVDDAEGGGPPIEVVDPFAGVPDEAGPTSRSPGGKRSGLVNRSPEGLLDDPVWNAATVKANEGYAHHAAAQAALKAKDNDSYLAKGLAARDLFNQVLEDTADWELGLLDKFGENDRKVSQIMAERERWFGVIRKYKGLRHQ